MVGEMHTVILGLLQTTHFTEIVYKWTEDKQTGLNQQCVPNRLSSLQIKTMPSIYGLLILEFERH